ncbi:hypothetical protein PQU92_06245 [Asticcacaulis sp. BYS171W]|uniref:Uncharacterized protein n=1 Tax=Asticcacaulis aquaticus TaxID=2984212 RepID=A0ABT5HSE0_9CAUL|nr:hypothetical protein [Asticcacaulis aquaticus]MDC7682868.1 hypothetical protein [Asticcacaulis aquaticus]
MTLKTLFRPDMVAYFKQEMSLQGTDLTPPRLLIAYLVLFAYIVNVRWRPVSGDVSHFAGKLYRVLKTLDLDSPKKTVFCVTRHLRLPEFVNQRIGRGRRPRMGLYSYYSAEAPTPASLLRLCDDTNRDAAFVMWCGTDTPAVAHPRLVYSGPIFISRNLKLNGAYISYHSA